MKYNLQNGLLQKDITAHLEGNKSLSNSYHLIYSSL